jgi:hypothetical protein
MKTLLFLASLICPLSGPAQSTCRYVTLTATNGIATNTIQIQQGETGELITSYPLFSANFQTVSIIKDGMSFQASPASFLQQSSSGYSAAASGIGATVSGPAQFAFNGIAVGQAAMMTVKITPMTYDVNKTLILPPSTNQVYVTLQCSSNLVNWTDCTNGVYGSPIVAQFFRIRMGSPN